MSIKQPEAAEGDAVRSLILFKVLPHKNTNTKRDDLCDKVNLFLFSFSLSFFLFLTYFGV